MIFMQTRLATSADIQAVTQLGRQLLDLHTEFDFDYYRLEETFDSLFGTWVKNQINYPSQFIIVAEEENKITGFVSGFIKSLYPWFKTKKVGHLAYLVVDPNNRRRGTGRILEKAAADWFKSNGISYIEVYVEEKNGTGIKAWESYGFLPFKKFLRKRI
jgi:ribosomal protein S18 acetylase RimI-like enzyme